MTKKRLLTLSKLQASLSNNPTTKNTNRILSYITKHYPALMHTRDLTDVFDTKVSVDNLQGIDDNEEDFESDQKLAKQLKASPYNWFHTGGIPVKANELISDIKRYLKSQAYAKE